MWRHLTMAFDYQIINYSFSIPLPHLLDRMDGAQIIHYFLPLSACDLGLLLSLSAQMLFLIDIINFLQTFLWCSSRQHLSISQTTINLSLLSWAESVVSSLLCGKWIKLMCRLHNKCILWCSLRSFNSDQAPQGRAIDGDSGPTMDVSLT